MSKSQKSKGPSAKENPRAKTDSSTLRSLRSARPPSISEITRPSHLSLVPREAIRCRSSVNSVAQKILVVSA